MWSASMFVTTETTGQQQEGRVGLVGLGRPGSSRPCRGARWRRPLSLPPITKVGSMPPSARMLATSEVVVVLPWVPANGDTLLEAHQLGQHLGARHHRDMWRSRAAITSGCRPFTAVDTTTASASATLPASCPWTTGAQRLAGGGWRRCRQVGAADAVALVGSTSAMPLMPAPPMPTKWMF